MITKILLWILLGLIIGIGIIFLALILINIVVFGGGIIIDLLKSLFSKIRKKGSVLTKSELKYALSGLLIVFLFSIPYFLFALDLLPHKKKDFVSESTSYYQAHINDSETDEVEEKPDPQQCWDGIDPYQTVYVSRFHIVHESSKCSGMQRYTSMYAYEAYGKGYQLCHVCW